MPKSYELKLREAEERRRPRLKAEVYRAVEGKANRMLLGYDHPESIMLEMQLTYAEDTMTVDQVHDHLLSEVHRLNMEYNRKPLRCDYGKKYIWFDRFILRPRLKEREMVLQDYAIVPGYRLRIMSFHQGERLWGMPDPMQADFNRPLDKFKPENEPHLLVKVGDGPDNARNRLFCWHWLGGESSAYIPLAKALPKDWVCYVLEMPNRGSRIAGWKAEGYPDGEFAVEVMAKTLANAFRRPANNYFFGHSLGAHFMYYTTRKLAKDYGLMPTYCAVSNYAVPSTFSYGSLNTLVQRNNACVPLRIFMSLIKRGYGLDPKLGFMSHTGWKQYQTSELWLVAKMALSDYWSTIDFPLPSCDEALPVPIVAFYGKEDTAISREMVEEWRGLTKMPQSFDVVQFTGGHLWFSTSTKRSEELADKLVNLAKRFR